MWAVLKIDKKNLELLKNEFKKKLGDDVQFYTPKLQLKKFLNKKIYKKEILLLGDYLLCFHKDFSKKSALTSLRYCKGLRYFLSDFFNSQKEIQDFIQKCKGNENEGGFIKPSFFDIKINRNFEFISGPFTNMVFKILHENKSSIKAFIGNYKFTVSKEQNLFRPV
tara:strand:+ start:106 stop:603 length:498 start_codon:yes stop_codon:yes gene_type:complete